MSKERGGTRLSDDEVVWSDSGVVARSTSRHQGTSEGSEVMRKIMIPVVGLIMVALVTVANHGVAEGQTLLEVDVDDEADITQVRDGNGDVLEPVPFAPIGHGEFDLVRTRSLLFAKASGKGSEVAVECCKRGGRWKSCSGLAGTTMINIKGEVVEDGGTPEVPIESATIQVLKSHAFAVVVGKDSGDYYGMVVSADGMLYAPEEFAPTGR
jgi:hypothetical protein